MRPVSKTHGYERISHFEVAERFSTAYLKTRTVMQKVITSFRDQGVWLLCPEECIAVDFEPVQQTNYVILQIMQEEEWSAEEILT
jgi:hypothetical protein